MLDRAKAARAKDRAEFEASRPLVETDPAFVGPTMGGRINKAVDESLDASKQASAAKKQTMAYLNLKAILKMTDLFTKRKDMCYQLVPQPLLLYITWAMKMK